MLSLYIVRVVLADCATALSVLGGTLVLGSLIQVQHNYPYIAAADLLAAAPIFVLFATAHVLPVAVLVGTIWAYARLAADLEVAAMAAAGVRPLRIALPAIAVGIVASAGALYLFHRVVPPVHHRKKALALEVFEEPDRLLAAISRGRQVVPGWLLSFERREGKRMDGLVVVEVKAGRPVRYLAARSGECTFDADRRVLALELQGVTSRTLDVDGMRVGDLSTAGRVRLETTLGLASSRRVSEHARDLTTSALLSGKAEGVTQAEVWTEVHRRTGLGLAPLAFAILGVPLGLLAGVRSPALILGAGLIPVFGLYYPAMAWAERAASPVWSMVGPDLLVVALAALAFVALRGRGGRTGW